jgi:methionyl-tRNA formyltransferase
MPLKIVFWGTPDFAVPCLQALLADPAMQILGVVTQPDKRRGRGNQLLPSPIKQVALQHQLPVWQPRNVKKDAETLDSLRGLGADVFVVVAYGQILSPEILAMPRLGCINNHASLLPAYRGAAPIQWSIYHGDTETGITTMLMDAGMDTGAMLLKSSLPIDGLVNAEVLGQQLAEIGATLLGQTLQQLEQGSLNPTPQDNAKATYAPLIKKPDYPLAWHKPAIALHNQIRAFYPDCWAGFRGQPLKILSTVPLDAAFANRLPPEWQAILTDWRNNQAENTQEPGTQVAGTVVAGTVVGLIKQKGPVIQTGQGDLLLVHVQPSGKRSQSGWDFANGNRLTIGEVLS